MGNSGSNHQQQVTLVEGPFHSLAHSFPHSPSIKVLPDRVPGQRLRLTDNGAILHNGGTISGRKPYIFEPESTLQNCHINGSNREHYHKTLYGSEPDLRYSRENKQCYGTPNHQPCYSNTNDNSVKARIGKSRKKYKAPLAPHVNSMESSSPNSFHPWETSAADSSDVATPCRRSRLFKTKAETKRPSVKHVPSRNFSHMFKASVFPSLLQRSLSSPQFQDELTAKLRERTRVIHEPLIGKTADSPLAAPLKEFSHQSSHDSEAFNSEAQDVNEKLYFQTCNSKCHLESGNLSNVFLQSSNDTMDLARHHSSTFVQDGLAGTYGCKNSDKKEFYIKKETRVAPVKRFYFGMKDEVQRERLYTSDSIEVDEFAAALRKTPIINNSSPAESYFSEASNFDNSTGILLKLRPTLPRKQLDIPRFSPTVAWRLLSALESSTQSEEDDLLIIEEQISQPHIENHLAIKSGDSGISGDASPQCEDSTYNSQVAWTPQQDLEETSSDGGLESALVSPESTGTTKISPRFSLSLPKDEKVLPYLDKVYLDSYASLSFQHLKLKRSISGALSRCKEITVSSLDENWLLSRSVLPNLFNNSYIHNLSRSSQSSSDQLFQEDNPTHSLKKPSSFSYLANGGHIIYLPEYKYTLQKNEPGYSLLQPSKSHKDLTHEDEHLHPNYSQIDNNQNEIDNSLVNSKLKSNFKFTFQSTIRQIERKQIAEKLSKEMEEKEKQRLQELEAMKRVEEEFQWKREREKVDIRHQLYLHNLMKVEREQADGAVVPLPPHSTQILSEFQQPRRDYRDYTPMKSSNMDSLSQSDFNVKRETVHPEVFYKIPKNTQVYVTPHHSQLENNNNYISCTDAPRSLTTTNYRRDFAQGALPHSVASSDSELSQSNAKPIYGMKQRNRSASPAKESTLEENQDNTFNMCQNFDNEHAHLDNIDIGILKIYDNNDPNKVSDFFK